MAILGGAILPAVQGLVSDFSANISLSFYVPIACFMVVLWYASWVKPGSEAARSERDKVLHVSGAV